MPTKSQLSETPPTAAPGDPSAPDNADRTVAGRQPGTDQGTSPADGIASVTDSLTAERTERRRQRAAAQKAPSPSGESRTVRRRERLPASTTAPAPPRRMTLRDSVSIGLIAVLAAGGVLGAVLGALNVAGWVIGVLVAGLTVVVSAILRRYSRST
jgi:hypothetical protein